MVRSSDSLKPTVFHVTHWKAGSQWVRAVLKAADPDRLVPGKDSPSWFFKDPIVAGGVYTPVYATYQQFRQIIPESASQRTFALIRDPRDAAVSWYFSLRYSHPSEYDTVSQTRQALEKLDKQQGMDLVFRDYVNHVVEIQRTWLESGAKIFRYEDLLADQAGVFRQMLDFCEIDLPDRQLKKIVGKFSFRRRTWWRFGRENVKSHFRKGVAGDWKNHFDGELKQRFKSLYGDALIRAGYEKSLEW
jgi:lipopolysaccharide transport system ATP-binding protein